MGQPDEIAQWLGRQLDEDEAPRRVETWHEAFCLSPEVMDDGTCFYCGAVRDPDRFELCDQPAGVLAQVAAHRAILWLYQARSREFEAVKSRLSLIDTEARLSELGALAGVVRHLATAYASRDGYDESWRPA